MGKSDGVIDQVLVVAHDQPFWAALHGILEGLGIARVAKASSAEEALSILDGGVDAVFVSAWMPDRLALRVAHAVSFTCPAPLLIVVSDGPHPDLFELARAGAQ